jgi:hypothetical protein
MRLDLPQNCRLAKTPANRALLHGQNKTAAKFGGRF